MGRGRKILIGVVAALLTLLLVNTLIVEGETKSAQVTVPGGRLLKLGGGVMQVLERGPRDGSPIVLIHCYTCAIDWWDRMIPRLDRDHRVIAVDLRGFGGSEKPGSGYSMEDQAALVAEALKRLDVHGATVVGHSLGGTVGTALTEVPGGYVKRLVLIDQAPTESFSKGLPLTAEVSQAPIVGPALWQVTPDFAVKEGLGVAFAPGYDVPDAFVEDFDRMTYTSYDSDSAEGDYTDARPLDRRIEAAGLPLLAIFGAEDQIYDSKKALAAYARVPGAETRLIAGAGHSPNVEKPAETARLIEEFAKSTAGALRSRPRDATERGPGPQRSAVKPSLNRASGVRSATGDQ
jgi:pimeloyl-ACP methyl ester carboxylesterase